MSLNIGELVGYIKLDHTGVGQGITAAQRDMRTGMDRIQRDAGQQGERAGKAAGEGLTGGFKGTIGNLAKIAVGAFAVERVVSGLRTLKDAASDSNETVAMSTVVFGRNTAAMKAWAAEGPRALGLSTEATLRATATYADMFKQLGIAEQSSIEMSKATVQLAADLGSFRNLKTEDVLDRIAAGFRGEYDSLQKLIPNISDARIQTEALAASGKSSVDSLTAQEKTMAVLAIVQKDGAAAAGAYAKNADNAANASKTATAQARDLAAEYGQKLLPAYTAMVTFGRDEVLPFLSDVASYMSAGADAADPLTDAIGGLVGTFRDLPEPLQAATLGIIALVALRGRVEAFGDAVGQRVGAGSKAAASGLDSLRLGLMYASEQSDTAAGRFGAVTKSLGASAASGLRGAASGVLGLLGGPWGLAFGGAIAILGTYIKRQQEAKARVESLTGTLDAQTGAITKNTREQVRNRLEQEGVLKTAQKLGLNLQDVYEASLGNAEAYARINAEIGKLLPQQEEYGKTITRGGTANVQLKVQIADVLGAIQQQTSELDSASSAAERKAAITIDGADAEGEYGTAVDETTKKVEDQAQAVRDAAQAVLDSIEAKATAFDTEIAYQAALDDTAAAVKENGKTATKNRQELDLTTEAGRANATVLADLRDRAIARAEADLQSGESLKSLRGDMKDARTEFVNAATDMGLSKDAAEKMATEFGLTKGTVDNLATAVENLPASKTIRIEAQTAAAKQRLQELKAALDQIKSKKFAVVGSVTYVDTSTTNGSRTLRGGQTINEADGGVVSYYADGAHVAQRAPAGSVRVWNEPETGGETYIPHALSKRPRSTAILAQTADEFGYQLAPKGQAAAGATSVQQSSTHYHHYDIGNMSVADYSGFRETTDEEARVHNLAGGL